MNQSIPTRTQTARGNEGVDHWSLGCFVFPALIIIFLITHWLWSLVPATQNITTEWTRYESVFHQNLQRSLTDKPKFELDFSNQDWSAPYLDSSINGGGTQYDWIFTYDAVGVTASHYPAIPAVGWLAEKIGVEELIAPVGSLLLALALTCLVCGIYQWFGFKASVLCLTLLLADPLLHASPHFASMDGFIAALIILAFVGVVHGLHARDGQRVIWRYPLAGAMLGATTLFQFQQNLWLMVFLAAWGVCLIMTLIRQALMGRFFEGSLLFMIGLIVVVAPWWVRNCKTTGEFKPLGHAILSNLVGAYSDEAVESKGNLNTQKILKHRMDLLQPLEFSKVTLLEKENLVADSNWELVTQWAEENPSQVSGLVGQRICNQLGFGSKRLFLDSPWIGNLSGGLAIAGAFACLLCWRKFGGVILTVFTASLLVTALTWSDEGRLFIPVRPLLDAALAVGLVKLVQKLQPKESQSGLSSS